MRRWRGDTTHPRRLATGSLWKQHSLEAAGNSFMKRGPGCVAWQSPFEAWGESRRKPSESGIPALAGHDDYTK